jgi:UPF0755 protein
MTDRSGRPNSGRPPIPRRDQSEIEAHLRKRDRSDIEAHLRNRDRADVEEHLRNRDKTAAARERALTDAQARSRARAAGSDGRTTAFLRRPRRSRNRTAIIIATLISVLLISAVVVPPLAGNIFRSLAEANPDLMRFGLIADSVASVMDGRPDKPAGTDPLPVEFAIEPGASSAEITQELVDRGFVTDRLAFTYVLVTEGGLNNLLAGTHVLTRTMTPRELALALQGEPTTVGGNVAVSLRDGLRLEQIIAQLETLPLDDLDFEQFYDMATDPPQSVRDRFPWLSVVPDGRSLEGFLASGVYNVPADIDAETMLDTLLEGWQNSPSYGLMQDAMAEGKDFYQVVVLASIVQHEALHDSDKPKVAGVYQNRVDGLGGVRTLNADPVIIYAKDTMDLRDQHISEWPDYAFWTYEGIGAAADFEVTPDLASFQVWHSRGLPAGPICTPDTESLQAALEPDTQDGYLYFLGKNDASGDLVFARTYEEHLHNIEVYLGGGSPAPTAPSSSGTPTDPGPASSEASP